MSLLLCAAMRTALVRLLPAFFVLLAMTSTAHAQYFGRNKVQYRSFDFQILKTDHFDIYYYPEEAEAAQIASRMAERWHARLSRFFGHDLRGRQAIILYAVPAHFRQTNAVEGIIGEGTGGVTEAIKRRVVLPMSGSLADTDHVLGHELVHAFQFDLTGDDPREHLARAPDILQYPLWFVEGMAEYLSIGPVDAQTAMWLRDAALREKLPHIRELEDPKYFPYRWGHAFWAYIGAKYGDRTVASLIRSAANPRYDLPGLARQLGTDPDTLTSDWHAAIQEMTRLVADDVSSLSSEARPTIDQRRGGGRFNIGPQLSPNGKEIAFFSERDRFSIELFLADAETGQIKRKLSHTATDPHFDSLEFLTSAGAWSPDGKMLVIAAQRSGKPVLAMIDPGSGRITREVALPGLDDALHPVFSPDGRAIVLSGNRGGLIDLYHVKLDTGHLDRLTADAFADLEPVFTPDGKSIIFVTERYSTDIQRLEQGPLRLARLDLATHAVTAIPGFLTGKHLSPQVSADGRSVTFIAEPDGVSNVYRMPIDGGPIVRLTSFVTGVAGITSSSPALSSSPGTGRLAFSVFEDDGHAVYVLDEAKTVALVAPEATGRGALLPGRATPTGDVQRLLADPVRGLPAAAPSEPAIPYKRQLTLDAIGQPTFGVGVSSFGAQVFGSVSAFFSDMLGDRFLGVSAQVGGTLADLGGQVAYVSRKNRWNWAGVAEQLPYRLVYMTAGPDPQTGEYAVSEVTERQTNRGVFGTTAFPFNASTRVEFSGGARALTFTRDAKVLVYDTQSGRLTDRRDVHTQLADPMYLGEGSAALVHDTSFFGATGPIYGSRYRLELSQTSGTLNFTSVLADWRRYFLPVRPVTIAVRALHYGRYGPNSQHPQLLDLFIGYPELVHGYGIGSFSAAECLERSAGIECGVFKSLMGSRMLVTNIEVRAPLLGLFTHELEYGRFPVEVAGFFDSGVAWTAFDRPTFAGGTRDVVRSVGGAARANIFGLVIVEIAASHPFDRVDRSWQWQIGIRQSF
jgi:Tol biopolymer transport system component